MAQPGYTHVAKRLNVRKQQQQTVADTQTAVLPYVRGFALAAPINTFLSRVLGLPETCLGDADRRAGNHHGFVFQVFRRSRRHQEVDVRHPRPDYLDHSGVRCGGSLQVSRVRHGREHPLVQLGRWKLRDGEF